MSGALLGLSQYGESDSDGEAPISTGICPPARESFKAADPHVQNQADPSPSKPPKSTIQSRPKRKLPPLEADSLQQGGQIGSCSSGPAEAGSSAKKVARGDWLCYCFVEVPIQQSLSKLIQQSHDYLQAQLGSNHTVVDLRTSASSLHASDGEDPVTAAHASTSPVERLHISLTRPFTVRSYEREDYVRVAVAEVKKLKKTVGSFAFSFSRIAHLANDDASRHFMVLEVGSGRDKFHKLSTALSTELRRAFRAKTYYEEARFHSSTACVNTPTRGDGPASTQVDPTLATRIGQIIHDIEIKWGTQLRKGAPTWAARIGIQVANRIHYVDL